MSQEITERSFTVPAPARLKLNNIRGSVDIQPGEDSLLAVTAVKHLDSGDAERTVVEMSQAEGGSVSVTTRFSDKAWMLFNWSKPCKVDYTVRMPRRCSLKVDCVSSSASIRGLEGDFKFSMVSGPLTIQELNGELQASTVSGEISGERLSGPARLKTVSGAIRLRESDMPSANGSTVSGAIWLQTPLGSGPYHFDTVSGNVELVVPPQTGCVVQWKSLSGRFETHLHLDSSQRVNGSRRAEVHGGGPEIHFSSVSGDLLLNPSGDLVEQPVERTPEKQPAKPLSAEYRREVLERVARGEISAEEGLNALKNA